MPDINKMIQAENLAACEADAVLLDLEPWDEDQVRETAAEFGLEMTEERMEALCWLRDHHAECGPAESARALFTAMEDAFAKDGGKRYLYQLFPRGPIAQGCKLAGLPIPPGTNDLSFGSTH